MRILGRYLRHYWKLVVTALVLAAINQVFSLLDPLIFRHIIDSYATRYREYSSAQFLQRREPPAGGRRGSRPGIPRREELPGLLRQPDHPAGGGAHLRRRRPALAGTVLRSVRRPAQRRDPGQVAEGALRRGEVHFAGGEHGVHDPDRSRLRDGLCAARALVRGARVSRHGAAAGRIEFGAEPQDQGSAEADRPRDDGAGGSDHGVAAQHRTGKEPGAGAAGDCAPQRDHRRHPQAGAEEGALPAQPELRAGHLREPAANVDSVPDAVPDLHPADHRGTVLFAVHLFVLHLRPAAGTRQRDQRVSRDGSLPPELRSDSGPAAGAAAGAAGERGIPGDAHVRQRLVPAPVGFRAGSARDLVSGSPRRDHRVCGAVGRGEDDAGETAGGPVPAAIGAYLLQRDAGRRGRHRGSCASGSDS